MKKRRKHSRCLNCEAPLERKDNYCSNCGQENTDHQISLGLLLKEFTSNFFSLDSRFAHTFKPFLFKPGLITNAFIEGKRVYYANPVRWYLVISIIHFFFMSKMFEPTVKDRKERGFGDSQELTIQEFDSLSQLPDSVLNKSWPFSNPQEKMIEHLIETTTLSAKEIQDSIRMESVNWASDFAVNKIIKMKQETTASLNGYLMRQIPIIIFFILPVYAFLLKLFFWRKGLYIKHLIHSLHLHSFYFFLLSLVWMLALIINDFENYGLIIATLITFGYSVLSFRNVYGVRIRWCIFRAMCIGFLYTFALTIVLILGVLISLALF